MWTAPRRAFLPLGTLGEGNLVPVVRPKRPTAMTVMPSALYPIRSSTSLTRRCLGKVDTRSSFCSSVTPRFGVLVQVEVSGGCGALQRD